MGWFGLRSLQIIRAVDAQVHPVLDEKPEEEELYTEGIQITHSTHSGMQNTEYIQRRV